MTRTCRYCSAPFKAAVLSPRVSCDDCLKRRSLTKQQEEEIECQCLRYCPTPSEIEAATAEIRAGWPPEEFARRAAWALARGETVGV